MLLCSAMSLSAQTASSRRWEGGIEQTPLLEHLAAVLDQRAVWTPERQELRTLLGSRLGPDELARVKVLLSPGKIFP